MLFVRMGWIVANAGVSGSLIIVGVAFVTTLITALSLSAICTNGDIGNPAVCKAHAAIVTDDMRGRRRWYIYAGRQDARAGMGRVDRHRVFVRELG